jgi:hypothetical protein
VNRFAERRQGHIHAESFLLGSVLERHNFGVNNYWHICNVNGRAESLELIEGRIGRIHSLTYLKFEWMIASHVESFECVTHDHALDAAIIGRILIDLSPLFRDILHISWND